MDNVDGLKKIKVKNHNLVSKVKNVKNSKFDMN